MIPAEALDKLLPRWRTKMLARYSPDFIDGFPHRHRVVLTRARAERRHLWNGGSDA